MKEPMRRVLEQGTAIFVRDLRVRYRRTALTFLWAIVPTATAAASACLAGVHLQVPQSGDTDYPVRIFLNLVIIQVFTDSLVAGQAMAVRCRNFIQVIPIRYEALLVAGSWFVLLNLGIRLVLLAVMMAHFGLIPSPLCFLGALALVALWMLGLGLGAFMTPLSYVYWDLRYAQSYLIGAAFFLTPVLYPFMTEGLLGTLNSLNPLTYLLLATQEWVLFGHTAYFIPFVWTALGSAVVFGLSLAYYRRTMPIGVLHI